MTVDRLPSRSVLADQVRDHLLEGILSGRYPPHSRIVETQVARQLGTSQAPVREALRSLEALGVVVISPFRGARVRRPTRREILEAYAVRSALEVLAARLAVPRMDDAAVTELAAYGEAMNAAAAAGDGRGVADADARLHGLIVELADSPTLEKVWRSLEPVSRTYISLTAQGADPAWSAHLHGPILEALRRHDADAVATAIERHFTEASANMAKRWPDSSLPAEAGDMTEPATADAPADRTTTPAGRP